MQVEVLLYAPDMYIVVADIDGIEWILDGRIWSPSGYEPRYRMWSWKLFKYYEFFIFLNKLHARLVRQKSLYNVMRQGQFLRKKLSQKQDTSSIDMYVQLYERMKEMTKLFEKSQIVKI